MSLHFTWQNILCGCSSTFSMEVWLAAYNMMLMKPHKDPYSWNEFVTVILEDTVRLFHMNFLDRARKPPSTDSTGHAKFTPVQQSWREFRVIAALLKSNTLNIPHSIAMPLPVKPISYWNKPVATPQNESLLATQSKWSFVTKMQDYAFRKPSISEIVWWF